MEKTFEFDKIPTSVSDVEEMIDRKDPFNVAAVTVMVLNHYKDNADETLEMVDYLKTYSSLTVADKQFYRDRLANKPYLMASYLKGSAPENDYQPTLPYSVTVRDNQYLNSEEGYITLYVPSSGADSDRPLKLREKDGNWYLWQNSLMVGVKLPKSQDVWM